MQDWNACLLHHVCNSRRTRLVFQKRYDNRHQNTNAEILVINAKPTSGRRADAVEPEYPAAVNSERGASMGRVNEIPLRLPVKRRINIIIATSNGQIIAIKVVQCGNVALPNAVQVKRFVQLGFAGHHDHNARAILVGGFHGLIQRRFNAQFAFGSFHCFNRAGVFRVEMPPAYELVIRPYFQTLCCYP